MTVSNSHKHNLLPVAVDGHPNATYACYGCDLVIEWDRMYGGWSQLQRNDAGFWEPEVEL